MLSFQYFSRGECLPDVTLEGQPSNSRSLSARSDPVIKRSSFSCHSLLPYSLTARVGSLSSVALFGLHLQYGIIFVGYSHLHGLFFITDFFACCQTHVFSTAPISDDRTLLDFLPDFRRSNASTISPEGSRKWAVRSEEPLLAAMLPLVVVP